MSFIELDEAQLAQVIQAASSSEEEDDSDDDVVEGTPWSVTRDLVDRLEDGGEGGEGRLTAKEQKRKTLSTSKDVLYETAALFVNVSFPVFLILQVAFVSFSSPSARILIVTTCFWGKREIEVCGCHRLLPWSLQTDFVVTNLQLVVFSFVRAGVTVLPSRMAWSVDRVLLPLVLMR